MNYTVDQLRAMPDHILLKHTLVNYESMHLDESPEAGIALIVGLSIPCIDNYKMGKGWLSRAAWKAIYAHTKFELIREWDAANRIGG